MRKEVFTSEQVQSIFRTFYDLYFENINETDWYYIVIDTNNVQAIRATKDLELLEDRYILIPVPSSKTEDATEAKTICIRILEDFFKVELKI